ncbi:hypothetical protein [Streptomyces corynorhini]|uniref:Uncharacterized protein n=1 Tax=Streptomyces corynorhini TaxID=2282652 RepID=A0A370B7D2_9ACTN|nr:hypothetical protein [Streptomyces corynorhini]RDG35335.1 hypothetical protein DVH02_25825 [Streptomyces corynorhini]
MSDQPTPLSLTLAYAQLRHRAGQLERAIDEALDEQVSLRTQLILTGLQKLDTKAFFERVTGHPAPTVDGAE